jgi:hypothetical protein
VLPAQVVASALKAICLQCCDSLYSPVTVLWLFLSQVIHANPTLAATVENLVAWRLGQGMPPCSTDTGAYARARQRLPEALLARLTRHTGGAADQAALDPWRWLGRTVKLFDGSTVSMPDTPKNQAAYPQGRAQAPGVGFPLARIGVLFSLSAGTVLDLGIRRWAGKFQSELAMLREMIAGLNADDVLLADRYLCSYLEIALLQQQGVDFVGRMHSRRKIDFRHGEQLGRYDHVVHWSKPARPAWMSCEHPRQISFTRAMRTLEAFRSLVAHTPSRQLAMLYEHMLQAIASHEIANRPNRLEPRQRKRRPKPYDLMTKPRPQARKQEAKTR